MKLYRFVASDTHKAISNVHDILGAEALIYSTRKTSDGIEVLASAPNHVTDISEVQINKNKSRGSSGKNIATAEIEVQKVNFDHRLVEHLNNQIRSVNENINKVMDHLNHLQEQKKMKSIKVKLSQLSSVIRRILTKKIVKEGIYERQSINI